MAATVEEFLLAAEYVLQGNERVILCERGVRSFERLTRNMLVGQADSIRIERTMWIERGMDVYTKDREGHWGIKDDAKRLNTHGDFTECHAQQGANQGRGSEQHRHGGNPGLTG